MFGKGANELVKKLYIILISARQVTYSKFKQYSSHRQQFQVILIKGMNGEDQIRISQFLEVV